jgi:uncharacterized protein (DUF1501 family)
MKKNEISDRRDFLKTVLATSATGVAPTFATLSSIAEAAAPGNNQITEVGSDYKAIVCVFLYGGQDHSNVLVPYQDNATSGTAEYDVYAAGRSSSGAAQSESGANLSYKRTTLGASSGARVITSVDTTPALPAGFTTNVYGRKFALHPSYSEIAYLYKQNKLAIMANVGPLIAPINRDTWYNISTTFQPSDKLPGNLYSHDDQQKAWMSGTANQLNPQEGAGGRIASLLASLNGSSKIPISVSVAGINTFMLVNDVAAVPYQVGSGYVGREDKSTTPASCNTDQTYIDANPSKNYCLAGGPIAVSNGYSYYTSLQDVIRSRLLPANASANIYAQQWTETMDLSVRTEQVVSTALIDNPLNEDTVKSFSEYRPSSTPSAAPINVVNPPGEEYNPLAAQLRMTAALIRASAALGASAAQPMKRQVFFVAMGGFDSHGSEFWNENSLLNKKIDRALDAFWQALGKIKVQGSAQTGQDKVTVFTMSEFGRTLDSNGQGSDHGWGSHHIVLGGAVKGGKIYGANHNVAATDIPNDAEFPTQKSRYMAVDATAGAMPRYGIPPLWYDDTQGTTGPGGKARTLIPGTANYLPVNHCLDRGELLATMASDAYVATIARWFGVSAAQLTSVFPTLTTAHPGFDTTNGVGFMNLT